MNTRKILVGGLLATAAIGGSIALASSANAATTNANGSVFVSKGEIQSALTMSNADFDKIKVTDFAGLGGYDDIRTVTFTCTDGSVAGTYRHEIDYVQDVVATPVWNGGHNQITGYTVSTPGTHFGAMKYSQDEAQAAWDASIACTSPSHAPDETNTTSDWRSVNHASVVTLNGKVLPGVAPVIPTR